MTGFKSIFCVIFSILLPFKTQAGSQIFFPLGNTTYWSPGSSVQLPWTYTYNKSEITNLQWSFTKYGSSTERRVAIFFIEAGLPKPTIDDPLFSITGQAMLEFKNANLGHNGTYTFSVLLRTSKSKESEIDVIILTQPTAVIKCSSCLTVEEGEDITCLCNATGGNPPATASWWKNGMVINETGYLEKNLILKNTSKEDTGTYNCTVRSHNLTDTKSIDIKLRVKSQPLIFIPFGNITYWSPGSSVHLPWTYHFTNSEITNLQWLFTKSGSSTERRVAIFFIEAGLPKPTIDDPMFSITGQATLEFKNANLGHNGTYTFRVLLRTSKRKDSEIDVVILEQPTAVIKCSSITVEEGEDITCLCSATRGNPPATASWSKHGMVINGTEYLKKNLILKNIGKEDTGTYNCTVRSHNLTDTKFINIKLKPKSKPRIVYFKTNVIASERVTIACVAEAYPRPDYIISFNGTQLADVVNGVKRFEQIDHSNSGRYECLAKNVLGNVSASFFLIVMPTTINSTEVISNNSNSTEKATSVKDGGGTEWYIAVITLFCGIGIGIIFSFAVLWLYRRRKENREHPKPSEARTGPETHDNPSIYQELDLQRMRKEDNYQSLRKTSRHVGHQEPTAEAAESSYQELEKVRGSNDDNNYQSLNRV